MGVTESHRKDLTRFPLIANLSILIIYIMYRCKMEWVLCMDADIAKMRSCGHVV